MTSSTDQSGVFVEGSAALIPAERIESRIYLIRGEKVILDSDLAEFYGVATKALNQSARRNHERFPSDFMFQLTEAEAEVLVRSQFVTARSENSVKPLNIKGILRSQFVTSKRIGTGGRRYLPYAFTEQGVAMLSGLLNSPRAIAMNIGIMRAFVRLRQLIASNADLAAKLAELESKYDEQFKVVFEAIRELMEPSVPRRNRELGFHTRIPALRPAKDRVPHPTKTKAIA